MKQILVTTGATVTFVQLIRAVLSERFIGAVSALGYTEMVVQYGGDDTSVHLVQELLSAVCFTSDNNGSDENTTMFSRTVGKLHIVALQWAVDLVEKYTRDSNAVISHAGVGSIMDTLRCWEENRTLIAVPNGVLLDNHQVEVARTFAAMGVLRMVSGNDGDNDCADETVLAERLSRTLAEPWVGIPLPRAAGNVLGRVIREELSHS